MTPLHMAAKRGCSYLVGYLIDKEADINIKDDNGVIILLALLIHTSVNLIPVYPREDTTIVDSACLKKECVSFQAPKLLVVVISSITAESEDVYIHTHIILLCYTNHKSVNFLNLLLSISELLCILQ